MAVWRRETRVEDLNARCEGSIHDVLGIRFSEIGPDSLSATMPVSAATRQPFGFLHGGASVVLAESLGSMAAALACGEGEIPVGIEVNANHLRAVREGVVTGVATPLQIGRSLHVWSIEIQNEDAQRVCVARLTVAIRAPKAPTT